MKPNIIVDIDGVICQYNFSKILKKHFGISVPNELIHQYSTEDCLGITHEEADKMWKVEAFAKPEFVEGAVEGLTTLQRMGYNIIILSNRVRFMGFEPLVGWIKQNNIPHDTVATCADFLPDSVAHIDDSPVKLLDVASKIKVNSSMLFVQPWNVSCHDIYDRFVWVESWKQVLEELIEGVC